MKQRKSSEIYVTIDWCLLTRFTSLTCKIDNNNRYITQRTTIELITHLQSFLFYSHLKTKKFIRNNKHQQERKKIDSMPKQTKQQNEFVCVCFCVHALSVLSSSFQFNLNKNPHADIKAVRNESRIIEIIYSAYGTVKEQAHNVTATLLSMVVIKT